MVAWPGRPPEFSRQVAKNIRTRSASGAGQKQVLDRESANRFDHVGEHPEVETARELKHRAEGDIRPVPCPPPLTAIPRAHLADFGTTPDGRISAAAPFRPAPTPGSGRRPDKPPSPPPHSPHVPTISARPAYPPGSTPACPPPRSPPGPATVSTSGWRSTPNASTARTKPSGAASRQPWASNLPQIANAKSTGGGRRIPIDHRRSTVRVPGLVPRNARDLVSTFHSHLDLHGSRFSAPIKPCDPKKEAINLWNMPAISAL